MKLGPCAAAAAERWPPAISSLALLFRSAVLMLEIPLSRSPHIALPSVFSFYWAFSFLFFTDDFSCSNLTKATKKAK